MTYTVCAHAAHGMGPAGSWGQRSLRGVCLPVVTCAGPVGAPQLKAGRGQERWDDGLQLVTGEPGEGSSISQLKKTSQDQMGPGSPHWGRIQAPSTVDDGASAHFSTGNRSPDFIKTLLPVT